MNMTGQRDLEREREELLRILEENTDKEIKRAIEIALSGLPQPWLPQITHSTKGTDDAHAQ